jgi:hypothetical protein
MICARKTGMGMTIYQTVKVADFSHKKLEPIWIYIIQLLNPKMRVVGNILHEFIVFILDNNINKVGNPMP